MEFGKKIIKMGVSGHNLYVTDEDGRILWFEGAFFAQMDTKSLEALKETLVIDIKKG